MLAAGRGALTGGSTHTYSNSDEETRGESYMLLMELVSSEPTMQNCFKIIESTCLAQGIDISLDGNPPTKEFKSFVDQYYIPFLHAAIRAFFTCGFCPWRLRKLPSGDPVPEVIPLGLYTWTIETDCGRPARMSRKRRATEDPSTDIPVDEKGKPDVYARMADVHFKKQASYFADDKRQPYHLQGDLLTMAGAKRGAGKAVKEASVTKAGAAKGDEKAVTKAGALSDIGKEPKLALATAKNSYPASYHRQKSAMDRHPDYYDEDDSKLLHYRIAFNRSCAITEDEVEIYEYIQPSMDISANSVLYRAISSPLSHVLMDYRNLRRAVIRKEHADTWNCQSHMICSYTSQKNIYQVSEGGPITNDWYAQNRAGTANDTNLPMEMDQNAYTRDAITETIANSKKHGHTPVVYTLPKNSKLETVPQLSSLQDTALLEVQLAKSISSILGVPFEIIGGGYGDKQGAKKSLENSKIFTTNMVNITRHLQALLRQVYVASFGSPQHKVEFILRATPRIEVTNVDDLCKLLETGVVSFDNAMDISNMLLGLDLLQSSGRKANAGQFQRSYVTPSHKKDLLVAASAQQKAKQGAAKK